MGYPLFREGLALTLVALAPGAVPLCMLPPGFPGSSQEVKYLRLFLKQWVRTVRSPCSFRMDMENILMKKALEQPFFGWGGWGRNRVIDDEDNDITVTDGLWIMVLGTNGIVGLLALAGVLLLPILAFAIRFPPAAWPTNPWPHPRLRISSWSVGDRLFAECRHNPTLPVNGRGPWWGWTRGVFPGSAMSSPAPGLDRLPAASSCLAVNEGIGLRDPVDGYDRNHHRELSNPSACH